jgi:hypothetical protein
MNMPSLRRAKNVAFAFLLIATLMGASSLQSQNINPAFTLNDPSLFWPGTNAGGAPGYPGQWYLQNELATNQNNAGIDADVAGSWMDGFDGTGVTIAICDEGVNGTHPDLNYDAGLSWSFTHSTAWNLSNVLNRGFPPNTLSIHGTGCAGVAAGIGNGIGITGAAPRSRIVSEVIHLGHGGVGITGEDPEKEDAAVYLWEGQKDAKGKPNPYVMPKDWNNPFYRPPIAVKNHSYSANEGYAPFSWKRISYLQNAIQACSDHRIINVLSSGNERAWPIVSNNTITGSWFLGTTSQDTGKKIVNSFPGQIITAALSSDGTFAKYSSFGSCVFVTAPSSDSLWNLDRTNKPLPIVTTDFAGPSFGFNNQTNQADVLLNYGTNNKRVSQLYNYDSLFGGTSSAAPLVAGIMADGVSADPYLDVRTAHHLLALTCSQVDPYDKAYGGWITNAAGYAFDPNYGFGLIDGTAFTTACSYVYDALSVGYYPLSNEEKISAIASTVNAKHPKFLVDVKKRITNASVDIPVTLPRSKNGYPVESITVRVHITGFQTNQSAYYPLGQGVGASLGDITIRLISPRSTSGLACVSDNFGIPDPTQSGQYLSPQLNLNKNLSTPFNPLNFQAELTWQYLSWAYFGEQPEGIWTVRITNTSNNTRYSRDLKVDHVEILATLGYFDASVLGNLPLANGPSAVR